jgi:hypothetical protein
MIMAGKVTRPGSQKFETFSRRVRKQSLRFYGRIVVILENAVLPGVDPLGSLSELIGTHFLIEKTCAES